MKTKMETADNLDYFNSAKRALKSALFTFSHILNPLDFYIMLFKLEILHDKFAEEGIFITDKNKEEKYIEIIEKDNPELLDYLEKYLDTKEKVENIVEMNDFYNDSISKLDELDDKTNRKEINKIVTDFLSRYDSKYRTKKENERINPPE